MRIEWAVACRFVEVHDNLATIVGAGIDRVGLAILPQGEPIRLPVMFALRVAVAPGDEGNHQLTVSVLDDSMEQVQAPLEGAIEIGEGQPHTQPGWEGHHMVPVALAIPVTGAGVFTIVFSVDGRTFDYPLVVEVLEPGAS